MVKCGLFCLICFLLNSSLLLTLPSSDGKNISKSTIIEVIESLAGNTYLSLKIKNK